MKLKVHYFIGVLFMTTVLACNTGVEHVEEIAGGDSLSWAPEEVVADENELNSESDEVAIIDGTIDLESFQNKFNIYFEHQFDFGWRFITANYDEYPEDTTLMHADANENFDLSLIKAVSVEGDVYPISFEGYAHSYQYVNGGHIYVTYILGEISEELHYYYVNTAFEILDEGALAYVGGDEGAWSYSYGEFSKDFSVYHEFYAEGEGLDTTDYSSNVFYFE